MVVIVLSDLYHYSWIIHDEHKYIGLTQPKTSGASRLTSPRIHNTVNVLDTSRWHPLVPGIRIIPCPPWTNIRCGYQLRPPPTKLPLSIRFIKPTQTCSVNYALGFSSPTLVNFAHTWACSTLQHVVLQRIVFLLWLVECIKHYPRTPRSPRRTSGETRGLQSSPAS